MDSDKPEILFEYTNGTSFNGNVTTNEDEMRVWHAESIDDVNAAAAMLALKHGPKIYTEVFQNG